MQPMAPSVEHSSVHFLFSSFKPLAVMFNELPNFSVSRFSALFYIGGKGSLGPRHSSFSHNIDRSIISTSNNSQTNVRNVVKICFLAI